MSCTRSSGLEVSDTKWSCEDKKCNVTFYIENTSHNQILGDFAIRVHRRTHVQGSDAVRNEVIGEIKDTLVLNPGEKRKLERYIDARRRPDNIVVSVWVK